MSDNGKRITDLPAASSATSDMVLIVEDAGGTKQCTVKTLASDMDLTGNETVKKLKEADKENEAAMTEVVAAESARKTAEAERVSAENVRAAAENERVLAEQERAEEMSRLSEAVDGLSYEQITTVTTDDVMKGFRWNAYPEVGDSLDEVDGGFHSTTGPGHYTYDQEVKKGDILVLSAGFPLQGDYGDSNMLITDDANIVLEAFSYEELGAIEEYTFASGGHLYVDGVYDIQSNETIRLFQLKRPKDPLMEGVGNKRFESILDTVNRTEAVNVNASGSITVGNWSLMASPVTAYDGTVLAYKCTKEYNFNGEIVDHELFGIGATVHMIAADTEMYAFIDTEYGIATLYAAVAPDSWSGIKSAHILHIYNEELGVVSEHTHIQGKYNAQTDKTMAHVVGNGTDDENRSNAHTLDWEGNAEYAGDVVANGCGGESPVSLQGVEKRVKDIETKGPLVLYAEKAEEYTSDAAAGDEALNAILTGRQILVRVPNADGGNHTAIFSPVYMNQLPNYKNQYLYLFYLRDEKQELDLSALGAGTIQLPIYGELKMLLSEEYNESPLV